MIRFILVLFPCFFSMPAMPSVSYPMVRTLNVDPAGPTLKIKVGPSDSGSTVIGGFQPSDLLKFSCNGCKPTLIISLNSVYFAYTGIIDESLSSNTTYGELEAIANHPLSSTYSVDLKSYIEYYRKHISSIGSITTCAAVAWSPVQNSGVSNVYPSSLARFPLPVSVTNSGGWAFYCGSSGGAVIPEQNCEFNSSKLNVDFGTLHKNEIDKQFKTVGFEIKCGKELNADISLSTGSDSISLSNGLSATLSLDNEKLGKAIKLSKGSVTHTLGVKLSGSTSKAGSFKGSGALKININ